MNINIEEMLKGADKNADFLSFLSAISSQNKSSNKKKKSKKEEIVCIEEEEDESIEKNNIVVMDSDDEKEEEEKESSTDDSDEDDEQEDDDEDEEDLTENTMFNVLSNFLVDEQGNNIATSLSNIAYELHKINSYLKSKE